MFRIIKTWGSLELHIDSYRILWILRTSWDSRRLLEKLINFYGLLWIAKESDGFCRFLSISLDSKRFVWLWLSLISPQLWTRNQKKPNICLEIPCWPKVNKKSEHHMKSLFWRKITNTCCPPENMRGDFRIEKESSRHRWQINLKRSEMIFNDEIHQYD